MDLRMADVLGLTKSREPAESVYGPDGGTFCARECGIAARNEAAKNAPASAEYEERRNNKSTCPVRSYFFITSKMTNFGLFGKGGDMLFHRTSRQAVYLPEYAFGILA